MVGLPHKNKNAMQQWYHLFESRSNNRSLLARQHWQLLTRLGLPNCQHENWKYMPLNELLSHHFVLPKTIALKDTLVSKLALPLDAIRLVFVNGQFNYSLSDTNFDHFEIYITKATEHRNLPAPVQPEVFLHLTESLAEQVTTLRLAHNQVVNRPLYMLHISSGCREEALNTIHYRHHLQLESGTQMQVIEHYVSLNDRPHFTGSRLTMAVGNNAKIIHTKLLSENARSYHFAHNDIIAGRDTSVSSYSFLLGTGLGRHNTSVQFNGENSNLVLNSLALPTNQEICDTHTFLLHHQGYCRSQQLHKTIVRDRAYAVFNGLIKVTQHALKTDSQMINNNLLLGHSAKVDSKPHLEIYTDDVKCSHGATIGRIDEEQMFYLRARGISEEVAQHTIIYAFAAELVEAIEDKILKTIVLQCIKQRLFGTSNEF